MATIYLKDKEMHTHGELLALGETAIDVPLTKTDLSTITFSDFDGSNLLINVYPSIDTSVCFDSVQQFKKQLPMSSNTKLLCVSMDLPFALQRISEGTKGLEDIIFLSDFRNREFGDRYGLTIADGPLAGLLTRAVILLDSERKLIYKELVRDIANPPNYAEALAKISE